MSPVNDVVFQAVFAASALLSGSMVAYVVVSVTPTSKHYLGVQVLTVMAAVAFFSTAMLVCSLASLPLWLSVLIALAVGALGSWWSNDRFHARNYTLMRIQEAHRQREGVAEDQPTQAATSRPVPPPRVRRASYTQPMVVLWSGEAIDLVESLGVPPAEVNQIIGGGGQRLLIPLPDDDGWRVISDATGRLVEVWLIEAYEGWHEVIGAFETDTDGKARWDNAQEGHLR